MNNKIILDLCGGTGAWSEPYRVAGYNVVNITLPLYDIREIELTDLSITLIKRDNEGLHYQVLAYNQIYGILAAPPCTEFSIAKGNRPRDFEGGMEIVEACFKIIWACRKRGNLKFWAMENPRGLLRQFIGIPKYTFEQWQFGAMTQKPTDLWGYFKKPAQIVQLPPDDIRKKWGNGSHGKNMSDPKCPAEYSHLKLNRAAIRAITPKGFGQAFYKANP